MVSKRMLGLGTARSVIRELFEYGNQRAAVVGRENVYDFSLGNPSVPAPDAVNEAAIRILREQPELIHCYTSAQGDAAARQRFADSLNRRFGGGYTADQLYITVGAAASLCCVFHGLTCPGDEFIVFAPYFPEYKVFIEGAGAKMVLIPPEIEHFQIDFAAFEQALTPHTKGVVVNSPNNPSGVVYSADTLRAIAAILRRKAAAYGHPIYLISDEPYREIVFAGFCGAGRVLGYVNAPSLFQRVAAACDGLTADLTVYQTNRDLLYHGLTGMGYTCMEPGGTFYLLLQSPEPDAAAFCERAKRYDLLFPPTDDFHCPGWCRIAFCTATETVQKALPLFKKLAAEYGLN